MTYFITFEQWLNVQCIKDIEKSNKTKNKNINIH